MDKITVMRGNVVLDIPLDEKELYVNDGYSVIDEKGNLIEKAISNDVKTLQLEVARLREELSKKDTEIAKLKKPGRKATEKE